MALILRIVLPINPKNDFTHPSHFIDEFEIKAINIKEDPHAKSGWIWQGTVSTTYFSREMLSRIYDITTDTDSNYYNWNISLHFPNVLKSF
jgi:hypothetical protein